MSSFWTGSRVSRPAVRRRCQRGRGYYTERSGLWSFFDRVNTLGVEGEIILDRRDGSVWGLITPHSIDRTLAAERNAEVGGVPLVGAIGRAICPRQERHIDILARDVMDRRIMGLAERQRFARVGNNAARDRDDYSLGVAFDRDRMIRAGDFDRLRLDLDILFHSGRLWLKNHLAADRTSCHEATANQFRLFLHAGAYWLLWSMRRLMPKGSAWRVMQFDTLRLRLIKIAARVVELKTQIKIHLPSSTPDQAIFGIILNRLPRLVT